MPPDENSIYLTFDDGPHPTITPGVLDELKKYDAKATFFCIGKNVQLHNDIYKRIIVEGHAVGNHTQHHLNGWKVDTQVYLDDVAQAANYISTDLFRPPYGRIKREQALQISKAMNIATARIIMWDVLSADFDNTISKEECLQNVLRNISAGSVVVFHDSEKAERNMKYVFPKVLQLLSEKGSLFKSIG
jgi:peptidoglycan/xylan/chitin deacetylase (PgdA/CDA1 family)